MQTLITIALWAGRIAGAIAASLAVISGIFGAFLEMLKPQCGLGLLWLALAGLFGFILTLYCTFVQESRGE